MKRARVRRKRRKSLKRMKKPRAKRRKRRRATRRRRLPQRASAKCQRLRPGRPVPRPPLLAVMRRINGRCRPEVHPLSPHGAQECPLGHPPPLMLGHGLCPFSTLKGCFLPRCPLVRHCEALCVRNYPQVVRNVIVFVFLLT
jgi:transposase InsO family protein